MNRRRPPCRPQPAIGPEPPPNTLPIAEQNGSNHSNPYCANTSLAPAPTLSGSLAPKTETGKLAAATPGEQPFEGPQQPSIALEKVSPSEIQVGKLATFTLYVRNSGQVPAQNVVVTDHVPAGTQLIDVKPQPQTGSDGSLWWNLGTMQPGEETQITPASHAADRGGNRRHGDVSFGAAATSRSISTRPQLADRTYGVAESADRRGIDGAALPFPIPVRVRRRA